MALVEKTGVGRDINRHYYTADEVREALRRPVVEQLMALIRLRNRLVAFDGEFSIGETRPGELVLRWNNVDAHAELFVDLKRARATIDYSDSNESGRFNIGT